LINLVISNYFIEVEIITKFTAKSKSIILQIIDYYSYEKTVNKFLLIY